MYDILFHLYIENLHIKFYELINLEKAFWEFSPTIIVIETRGNFTSMPCLEAVL